MAHTVYTIGREFGSGGRDVGKALAARLEIPFYDKELLALSAKESGMSEALFAHADEKTSSSLFYSLVVGSYPVGSGVFGVNEMPLHDKLFLVVADTIKKLAETRSCVIVGRCADYVLKDHPSLVSVFIHAPVDERVKRVQKLFGVDESEAYSLCRKHDKKRANFYNYYSDYKWGHCATYDLSLDSSQLGIKGCVRQIEHYASLVKVSGIIE